MSNYTEFVTKSGERLLVKAVPRNMLGRFTMRLPKLPRPPLKTFTNADGVEVTVADVENPEYVAARDAQQNENNLATAMAAVHLGIRLPKERRAEIKEEIAELRERAAELGIEMHPDDETAYIWEVCLGDAEDMEAINRIMYAQTHPTPEAVANHTEAFRPEVQGPAAVADLNAAG